MNGNGEICIGDDMLLRYVEGDTDASETRKVQAHLNKCSTCFGVVASVIYNEKHPFTEEEMAEVDKLISPDHEAKLAKFLSEYYKNEKIPMNGSVNESEKAKISDDSIVDKVIGWFKGPTPLRPALIGLAAIVFISVVSIYKITLIPENSFGYDRFVYDDKVPHEDASGAATRGQSEDATVDSLLGLVQVGFKSGMSDYILKNYEGAIQTFEAYEQTVRKLLETSPGKEIIAQARDFYFYQGVSYFALFRSKSRDLTDQERARHSENAIRTLSEADLLARAYDLENNDREIYFLGLSYGFSGNRPEAVTRLRQIPETSEFYKQSLRFIRDWGEP